VDVGDGLNEIVEILVHQMSQLSHILHCEDVVLGHVQLQAQKTTVQIVSAPIAKKRPAEKARLIRRQ
jgi:hypothetical protein